MDEDGRPWCDPPRLRERATSWERSEGRPFKAALPHYMDQNVKVPFGQQPGPPATWKQVQELVALLKKAGFDGPREARTAMGFTQRQAAGKFTRDEAASFIDRLHSQNSDDDTVGTGRAAVFTAQEQLVRHLPTQMLAVELRRRGWTVEEP
jgi:hypothetical protein